MQNLNSWISAFRLRTLPLALSAIFMGSFLAVASGNYKFSIIALSIVTTLFLQILSNIANDYGDGIKGTDNKNRLGPERALQSGAISSGQMKKAIIIFSLLSFISGIYLIAESFGNNWLFIFVFLVLGISAIAAAIKYTIGKKAYGYSGLGDIFVFVFFGLTAVIGTFFLNAKTIDLTILLPAISMGLFSTGVLNLNNMRDIKNDLASGKHTFASKLGLAKAKKYHIVLLFIAMISAVAYTRINYTSIWNLIYIFSFPLFIVQLKNILKTRNEALLDSYLKKLALTTLLFSLLFGIGLIL